MIALLIGVAVAILVSNTTIPTVGTVKAVGVTVTWLDLEHTPVTEIDWGLCDNSTAYTMEPFNITNTENTPCILALSTGNLSASIISLTLTWNYTDTILLPGESVIVELTQTITATVGPYSYDITITATEVPQG
jgi:outer membrane protein assembly factor BamA